VTLSIRPTITSTGAARMLLKRKKGRAMIDFLPWLVAEREWLVNSS